jgi:hypothetical protein
LEDSPRILYDREDCRVSDDFKTEIKKRFDDAFGIERLKLFSDDIQHLENSGQPDTASALRKLLKEHFKTK